MEKRRLGRIGHDSSVLIYGAAALANVSQEVADAAVRQALDAGINHFDVAASYGDAEVRLGPWMPRIRDSIFLATKTGERDQEAAWTQINQSLERLQTDRLDLIQLHAVGDLAELDKVTGSNGAVQAAMRARDEGLVDAIGITGHGHGAPSTHLEALRRFPFDTVLTPWNYVLSRDIGYCAAYEALVEEILRVDAGLMVIKSVSRRNWPGEDRRYTTWYEPFDEQEYVTATVGWVLDHADVTGIATPGEVRLLEMVVRAERERSGFTIDQEREVLGHADDYASPFARQPA